MYRKTIWTMGLLLFLLAGCVTVTPTAAPTAVGVPHRDHCACADRRPCAYSGWHTHVDGYDPRQLQRERSGGGEIPGRCNCPGALRSPATPGWR